MDTLPDVSEILDQVKAKVDVQSATRAGNHLLTPPVPSCKVPQIRLQDTSSSTVAQLHERDSAAAVAIQHAIQKVDLLQEQQQQQKQAEKSAAV